MTGRLPARRAARPAQRAERSSGALADTRAQLLESATRLFAERGFTRVTVRDICRDAGANLAAVNYHFRDKLGLYTAVVDRAIAAMRETSDAAMQLAGESSPEAKLRHYVRTHFLRLVNPEGRTGWIHRLMQHELSEPTPAAARIAAEAILPRIRYLREVVAEIMGCRPSDPRVMRSVASVQTQCLLCARLFRAPEPFRAIAFPPSSGERAADRTAETEAVATHIAEFSLAGIRGLAPASQEQGQAR